MRAVVITKHGGPEVLQVLHDLDFMFRQTASNNTIYMGGLANLLRHNLAIACEENSFFDPCRSQLAGELGQFWAWNIFKDQ